MAKKKNAMMNLDRVRSMRKSLEEQAPDMDSDEMSEMMKQSMKPVGKKKKS